MGNQNHVPKTSIVDEETLNISPSQFLPNIPPLKLELCFPLTKLSEIGQVNQPAHL